MDPGYFDIERKQNPRETANFISKFCFWYTRQIFFSKRRGQLSIADVYRITPGHRAAPRGDALAKRWREQLELREKDATKKPSLLRAIFKEYGAKFLIVLVLYGVPDVTWRLMSPLCLGRLINYFSPGSTITTGKAVLYAVGVVGTQFMTALSMQPFFFWAFTVSMKVRVACCSLIYRKLLRLDLSAGGKASEGLTSHVINLTTNDAQRFDMATVFLVDLVRTPVEAFLTLFVMYTYVGVSAIVGVTFLLLFIPLQGYLGKVLGKIRQNMASASDYRIRLMNEVIQSIESIKMYTWEEAFQTIIGRARKKEMKEIRKSSWVRAVMLSCSRLNAKIAIFITLITYIYLKNDLTADTVFVIYAYYNTLQTSLVHWFPLIITYIMEALVSVRRMQDFLLLPEVRNQDGVDLNTIDTEKDDIKSESADIIFQSEKLGMEKRQEKERDALIVMKNFTAYRRNSDDDKSDKIPALTDVNLTIKPRTLTVIVGTVGSGKSTLLYAILKEIAPSSGNLEVYGKISYAAQEPWLFEATVRQNILFGQKMDVDRYQRVIKCCQLTADLGILPHGDNTVVGERGASLSGGQRARISLARCVYQHADVYLLDDPLAAVDAKVAQEIYEECVRDFLRDSAVVLVTHHAHYARHAYVVVMSVGQIVAQGSFNDLKATVPEFEAIIEIGDAVKDNEEQGGEDNEKSEKLQIQKSDTIQPKELNKIVAPQYEGESQQRGSVPSSVYLTYIRSGGGTVSMFALLALFLVAQVFYSWTDIWLKDWVSIEEEHNRITKINNTSNGTIDYSDLSKNWFHLTRSQCIYVYAAFIGLGMLCTWNKLVVFYNTCIKASTKLHNSMFRGVTNAPMWFFHHNPSGRILNRFTKDLGQVDTLLPVALVDCSGFFLEVVGILVVVCLVNWWLIFPTIALALVLLSWRNVYLSASRDLKRIEAIARSPSLSHLSSTVSGLSTIRSTREQQRTLAKEFDKLQDLHSSAFIVMTTANRAFGYYMDVCCCLYLALVTFSFFCVNTSATIGGNVGLAITQTIGLIWMCQAGMRQTAEVENHMTSVERIIEYQNLPSETPTEPDMTALQANHPGLDFDKWPSKGEIVFEDVSLQYDKPPKALPKPQDDEPEKDLTPLVAKDEDSVYAIRGVNFVVGGGEKVAVVGRTGAGKSSLIAALFRLNNISGRVSVDGVTAIEAGLREWRRRLVALPQRGALFAGTLRDNMDPCQHHTDAEIHQALNEVGLQDMVAKLPMGLDTKIGDGGGNLSAGQKQLLCLARAALTKSTVLVLDEATANVDTDTDKHIQRTIREKFSSASVLTIAHRLNTVVDYDRVIVMERGSISESGHPYELLTQSGDGVFRTLVEQTGKESAALLYKMAEESYYRLKELKKEA